MTTLESVLRANAKPKEETPKSETTTQIPITEEKIPDTPIVDGTSKVDIDFNDFNEKYGKKFGKEITKEEELTELFSSPKKIIEYESKLKEHEDNLQLSKKQIEDLNKKFEETGKYVDINKYIAEPLRNVNDMLLKYPDKDPIMMMTIGGLDLQKTDNFDLLVIKAKLDNPEVFNGMSDSEIKEYMAGKYDVDLDDKENWDIKAKTEIALQAKQVRAELKEMQQVEKRVPLDVEKLKAEMLERDQTKITDIRERLKPVVEEMIKDFTTDGLIIYDPEDQSKELFKYTPEIDDSFKSYISGYADILAQSGELNENTIKNLQNTLRSSYLYNNISKIIKARDKQIEAIEYKKWHNESHNDSPLSKKSAPVNNIEDRQKAAYQKIKEKMF